MVSCASGRSARDVCHTPPPRSRVVGVSPVRTNVPPTVTSPITRRKKLVIQLVCIRFIPTPFLWVGTNPIRGTFIGGTFVSVSPGQFSRRLFVQKGLCTKRRLREAVWSGWKMANWLMTQLGCRTQAARASGAVLSSSGRLTFDRSVMQDDPLDVNLAPCRYGSCGM